MIKVRDLDDYIEKYNELHEATYIHGGVCFVCGKMNRALKCNNVRVGCIECFFDSAYEAYLRYTKPEELTTCLTE